MTYLGTALIYAALQVTLLGSLVAILYRIACRWGPVAAARVAALGLGVFTTLTLAALCPLPSCWSWTPLLEPPTPVSRSTTKIGSETPSAREQTPSPSVPSDVPEAGEGRGIGVSLSRLRDIWDKIYLHRAKEEDSDSAWSALVPILFLSGAGLGLLRLVLGLWSVSRYRRRSRSIDDSVLRDLVARLQTALGCRRSVAVRESFDLSAPATAGWHRPFILLPSNWRTWTEEERRAVLAHELAHIHRADYIMGLLARLSVAVHFYHPLAHWLAGRLQLQQELAADALGASCAGVRVPYLRGLARLLLRQDDRPPRWPARAFLSSSGTLLRRIHMLRANDGCSHRPLPRFVAALILAVLVFAAVGISALRGPAQQPQSNEQSTLRPFGMVDRNYDIYPVADIRVEVDEANTGSLMFGTGVNSNNGLTGSVALNERNFDASSSSADKSRRLSFDLSYVPPDAAGVWAMRPAEFLRQPAVQPFAELIDLGIAEELRNALIPLDDDVLHAEAIEQIILEARFSHNDKAAQGKQNLLIGVPVLVRFTKDFDGKKLMRKLMPDAQEVHYRSETYQKGKLKVMGISGESCYYLPDPHTIVSHPEKTMRRVLDGRIDGTTYAAPADWQRVEQGLLAVVVDTRRALKTVKDPDPEMAPLFTNPASFVFGIDLEDALTVLAFGVCSDEKSAKALIEWTKTQIAKAKSEETAVREKKREEKVALNPATDNLLLDLLKHVRIRQQGPQVRLDTHVKIDWATLGKKLLSSAPPSK